MRATSYDFLVIGSGIAGLSYALHAAKHGKVAILTKSEVHESNTSYAQGGIAAAVGEADSWKLHEEDTLIAGDGICDKEAVRYLVQRAPDEIKWLRELGTSFDDELGLEGGHSRRRILHKADRTGWEIEKTVVRSVRNEPNIEVIDFAFVTDILNQDGRCSGVAAKVKDMGLRVFSARAVMLATGGCGRMYQHTTNPSIATGDGIALASKAGAEIKNMEFMQFHPTTLYHPQMRSFLISEAVRGAGGLLRNHLGTRFMYDYDDRLELAPRDVVSRAIHTEMKRLGTWCVYLDLTHLKPKHLQEEFPMIYEKLASVGIQIYKDWIPVVPAQHYSCGGVTTNLKGQTNVAGLYAAGEVACTGVHGANRLASNSLLEALVFGHAAAEASVSEPSSVAKSLEAEEPACMVESESVVTRRALQRIMTEKLGIERSYEGMNSAKSVIEALSNEALAKQTARFAPHPAETMNLLKAAKYVIDGALARKTNVGLHFNIDLA